MVRAFNSSEDGFAGPRQRWERLQELRNYFKPDNDEIFIQTLERCTLTDLGKDNNLWDKRKSLFTSL